MNFNELISKYSDLPQNSRIPLLKKNSPNLQPFLKKAQQVDLERWSDHIIKRVVG